MVDASAGAAAAAEATAAAPTADTLHHDDDDDDEAARNPDHMFQSEMSAQTDKSTGSGRRRTTTTIAAVVLLLLLLVAVVVVSVAAVTGAFSKDANPMDRATLVTDYINSIKLSAGTLAVPKSSTHEKTTHDSLDSLSAEEKALAWLIFDDPLQLWPQNGTATDILRLQQRYALLTLVLQFTTRITPEALSMDECDWSQIVTHCIESTERNTTGRADVVTEIDFFYGSSGPPGTTLSLDLGLLSNLTLFAVKGNALAGSLPSTLGMTWTNLETFDVSHNALTGSLPSTLGTNWTNLKRLVLSYNVLTGTIPTMARRDYWNNLQSASFENTSFVGTIPSGFCNTNATFTGLTADCPNEVTCSCCQLCCNEDTDVCTYMF